ncbi:MAG: hypothetical protein BGO38_00615 [Cellulomonas sp. 73-145]|uniref:DUF6318 family protein n=1 Tax=Cellulomonas sp. 73-145 TaxID=1895739 RepID=UPI00092622CE|nr:DUF6318 family protein [Cellulomonas sp. 73-145]MBN9327502.1 hypothetical protein [Cellulomonas sp.]OJV60089.1 MAG: hypothetical protein BGO38_00615 [Cellulomonas sp. 73-145]
MSPTAAPSSTPASATPTAAAVANPTLGPLPDGVAPARPAALDQPPTLDGAKAVAAYFLLLYPYAYQTGDLSAWNALAHPDCNFCASVRTHVSEATSVGRHTVGGAFTITAVKGTEVTPGKFFDIQVTSEGATSQVVITAGAVVKDQPAGRYESDIVVLFEDGTWRVRGVQPKQAE